MTVQGSFESDMFKDQVYGNEDPNKIEGPGNRKVASDWDSGNVWIITEDDIMNMDNNEELLKLKMQLDIITRSYQRHLEIKKKQ